MSRGIVRLCILALMMPACMSYHGNAKKPIPTDPVVFVDSVTLAQLDRVLVVPRYSSFAGVSTGAGHGPGGGKNRCYLADPFIYERGTPFSPRQPKATGLIWGPGWAFTGKGISIDGVTVFARGYRPTWVWDLWDRSARTKPVALERDPSSDPDV